MKQDQKALKSFAHYSGLAIQLGLTIYLGSLLGEWLDVRYPNDDELYTKGVTLAAVFLSLTSTILQVLRQQKKESA